MFLKGHCLARSFLPCLKTDLGTVTEAVVSDLPMGTDSGTGFPKAGLSGTGLLVTPCGGMLREAGLGGSHRACLC